MALDRHVKQESYTIRSLCFDDYWSSTYEDKQAGVLTREEYRIRIYNYIDQATRSERKRKHGAYTYEGDAPLTKEEFYKILDGDYGLLLKSSHQLCREFYVECMTNILRPRTIIDYECKPWTLEAGAVRVTFDGGIQITVGSFDIFGANLPTPKVLELKKLVLGVKYTEFYLGTIKEIIPADVTEYTAASEYVLCYDRTNYSRNSNDYWYDN